MFFERFSSIGMYCKTARLWHFPVLLMAAQTRSKPTFCRAAGVHDVRTLPRIHAPWVCRENRQ